MARPTQYGRPATETIRVRVTPEQKAAIRQVAMENRQPVASVLREAVDVFVADYRDAAVFRGPKPGDVAQTTP